MSIYGKIDNKYRFFMYLAPISICQLGPNLIIKKEKSRSKENYGNF